MGQIEKSFKPYACFYVKRTGLTNEISEEVKKMKKVLLLTLSFLLLGGLQAVRTVKADEADARLCRQATEEVKKTQMLMERAAPKIRACANDSSKAFFARALRTQSTAREALGNRRCRLALELTIAARRLTIAALKLCGDTSPDEAMPTPDEPILAPE
jgi:hypothetical protein